MEILELCVASCDPLVRYALVTSIEGAGRAFFTMTSEVATELEKRTGQAYRYFGRYHLFLAQERHFLPNQHHRYSRPRRFHGGSGALTTGARRGRHAARLGGRR